MKHRVAILGASENPERYAYKAYEMLKEEGFEPLPVNPRLESLGGKPVFRSLREIPHPIDTITMYVGPAVSEGMAEEILDVKPRRVIFNPGSENPKLALVLRQGGVNVEEACTLVLLRTRQF